MKQTTKFLAIAIACVAIALVSIGDVNTFNKIPFTTSTYSDQDPLGVEAIKKLEKWAEDNKAMTTFDVIACPEDRSVHEELPNEDMYNKPAITNASGEVLVPETTNIMGNGFRHAFVLRVSVPNNDFGNLSNNNVVVDWGDGNVDSVKDTYLTYKDDAVNKDTYLSRYYINTKWNSESEAYVWFTHTYNTVGKYRVKVIGIDFFGIMNGNRLTLEPPKDGITATGTGEDKSLLCGVYDDGYLIAWNHVNHTQFCANSPLLVEVNMATKMEFPQVHNCARLFENCTNLVFAKGFRDKFRSSYSVSSAFRYNSRLLCTDFRLTNLRNEKIDASQYTFDGCTLLGASFIDRDGSVGSVVKLEHLLPVGGFYLTTKRTMKGTFRNCSSLTSSDMNFVRAVLWENPVTKITAQDSNVFSGCTSLDLGQIPSSWGGNKNYTQKVVDQSTFESISSLNSDKVYSTNGKLYRNIDVTRNTYDPSDMKTTSVTNGGFRNMATDGNILVASCVSDKTIGLVSSDDGTNWITRYQGKVQYICYDKYMKKFYASLVDPAATVISSTNGIEWDVHQLSSNISVSGKTIHYITPVLGKYILYSTTTGFLMDDGAQMTRLLNVVSFSAYADFDKETTFVGTSSGLYMSTDGIPGNTFVLTGLNSGNVLDIKKINGRYYAACTGTSIGLHVSSDGITWNRIVTGGCFCVNKTDDCIFAGGNTHLYVSTDGLTFKSINAQDGGHFYDCVMFNGKAIFTRFTSSPSYGIQYCDTYETVQKEVELPFSDIGSIYIRGRDASERISLEDAINKIFNILRANDLHE